KAAHLSWIKSLGNSKDYNLLWMGPKLNPAICKNVASFQKVNRFPNTRELGRKDSLCKNIRALRLITRSHRFDFMPKSYLLPKEYEGLKQAFQKRPGQLWIKKPVASACGCGIKVIDSMKEVSKGETAVVSSYISNPLLINGYKFDLRLYVLVTSYSPLVIYLYQDRLTRFATEKYQPTGDSLRNKFMHLTNTSVNKKSALLRLKESGKDTAFLLRKLEDIIIKTIISAEKSHVAPPESYPPHKNNSFELYGFDILIDDTLKPWLLEVNESPVLTYDNPMSFKIKTHLLADTLTLVGVECQNPRRAKEPTEIKSKDMTPYMKRLEENKKILQRIKEEEQRQGGYVHIFPKNDTWYSYCPLLRRKDHTEVLYMRLFQDVEDAVENQHMEQFERKLPPLLKDTRASPGQKTHQMGKTMPPLSKTNSGTPRQQDSKPAPLQRSTSSPQPLLPLRKQAPIRIPAKDPVRALAEKLRREKYQNQVMRPQIQEEGKSGKLTPLQNDGVQYGGMTRRTFTSTAMPWESRTDYAGEQMLKRCWKRPWKQNSSWSFASGAVHCQDWCSEKASNNGMSAAPEGKMIWSGG
uniref:Tubulin--tyrosine ligase-like protein 5 n=1 Tax=Leptobrachium leishanense TaxID=445787 RepID=A0A8C5M5L8_9ANUR